MTDALDFLLRARQAVHGDFAANARVAQSLKAIVANEVPRLSASQEYALNMIFSKIARLVTGNPDEPDHWRDIAGYAELAAWELERGNDFADIVGTLK